MDYDSFCEQYMKEFQEINEENLKKEFYNRIDELTKDDKNYPIFFMLNASNYLKIFTDDQIYFLFVSSCLNHSYNIMKILLTTNFSRDGLKNFMIVYLSEVNEYAIFKWIYEKYNIIFNDSENDKILFNIIKTNNIKFLKWFLEKNIINFNKNSFYEGGFVTLKDKILNIVENNKINENIKIIVLNLYKNNI